MVLIRRFILKFCVVWSFNSKNVVIRRLWIRIYIVIWRKIMPFDTHDMKPIEYVVFYCILCCTFRYSRHWINASYCIVSLIFRHSRHSFACNFLNNGPIFNLIKLLELSQSPLSLYGVYMVFTYVSTVTTCFQLILVYFVSYISTVTTCTYKSYKHIINTTW